MYNPRHKHNYVILTIFLLSGLVLGGFLGNLLFMSQIPFVQFFNFLDYGKTFALASPMGFDLDIISFSFSFSIRITIMGIVGMVLSFLIYRKVI